jgi:uncharacterized protein (TIGR02246 family)
MPSLRLLLPLVVLLGSPIHALAATAEQEVAAATQAWVDAFNSRDPGRVLALYDPEAVFWGTVSPTLRDTPDEIREYFKGMPDRPLARVVVGEHRIRVFGEIAINTGYYTFSDVRDGRTEANASRFSFTYRRRDGKWWIVDHHSSRLPQPPS